MDTSILAPLGWGCRLKKKKKKSKEITETSRRNRFSKNTEPGVYSDQGGPGTIGQGYKCDVSSLFKHYALDKGTYSDKQRVLYARSAERERRDGERWRIWKKHVEKDKFP